MALLIMMKELILLTGWKILTPLKCSIGCYLVISTLSEHLNTKVDLGVIVTI
jgi:hypothetical protein